MSAGDVIVDAEAAGVRLEVVDDRLRWQGRASPELLDRLRVHKVEVVSLLADQWRDDSAAFAQMYADLAVVVQDLLAAGQKPGKVKRMFGLSWAEMGEIVGERWS